MLKDAGSIKKKFFLTKSEDKFLKCIIASPSRFKHNEMPFDSLRKVTFSVAKDYAKSYFIKSLTMQVQYTGKSHLA